MAIEISELTTADETGWDQYVLAHRDSTFFHQIGWKNVVEKTYNHKPIYLLAKEDGRIRGVLPLFHMKSRIFGCKMVSVPFGSYGGVCADSTVIEDQIIGRAVDLTKNSLADYLELRGFHNNSMLVSNMGYVTFILKLNRDSDVIWNGFNNKLRNAIRKSMKYNLTAESDGSVRDFFSVYARNMRDLGTPSHSLSFFSMLKSVFPDQLRVLNLRHEDRIIAGLLLLYFKDMVIAGWAASDRRYRGFNPNNLLYWTAIKTSCERGYKFFDFGRSISGSGTYKFKKPWGSDIRKLHYLYYLNNGDELPDTSQSNPKRQKVAGVWKKLPLSVATDIGPRGRCNFP